MYKRIRGSIFLSKCKYIKRGNTKNDRTIFFISFSHFFSFSETSEHVQGATADFEQDYYNNNNIVSKKEIQFGSFNSQLHGSSLRQSSTESAESSNAHLLDHNYAASSFDECFGESWKGIKI